MIINCTKAQNVATEKNKTTLIWADEFNGTGLPDPSKWGYEVGFVRNNESSHSRLEQQSKRVGKNGGVEYGRERNRKRKLAGVGMD